MVCAMAQRAALKIVASGTNRVAPPPVGEACLEALRQLPRAVSVVTFQRGAEWFGVTATALVEASSDDFEGSWVTAPSGVALRSDAAAALECESEEIIERHGRAIVIGRIRNVFKIGGSGALVYWRGAYDSIGWTDEEVLRAVGLFPAAR
jgi:flavin reductase (DIM6/NTAB) family NADH-FMN oxidoreductase RutF